MKPIEKLLSFIIICFFVHGEVSAGDGNYAVSRISPSLLVNANVVKRFEHKQFIVKSPGEAYYKLKYVLTILNENGDQYAGFSQYYSKFYVIQSIEGKLYDAYGKELRKVKNKDIRDYSGQGDDGLADDTRFKTHNFYYKVYPYTVSYEVEMRYNGTLFYPDWFPQSHSLMSVEESQFAFSCPDDYEFRYKTYQYNTPPVTSSSKGRKTYTWAIKDLQAIVREPYGPGLREIAPLVLFGPTEFEMQHYRGSMSTWKEFGKFIYTLNQGKDVLPENVKQAVHELTDGVKSPVQKIKLLYEYLKKNTRYISIQLGIGSWQTSDASFVATKKYGDCKALSNYMFSLLKEAGIKSKYALIMAGENEEDIFPDFPSARFNHAIICVPLQNDSMWLECTDQFGVPGYMGSFTGNRYALLVDETGGSLVRTPGYPINENLQVRNIKAVLGKNGTLEIKAVNQYTGLQQDDLHRILNTLSKEKIKEQLDRKFDFATYNVNQFAYREIKKSVPVVNESLDITVDNYATITGKRLFIDPNIMTRSHLKLNVGTSRKYKIELDNEFRDTDSVEIDLPAGYTPESIPKNVSIKSRFGNYNYTIKLTGNKLYYYREMEQFSGKFPPGDYEELAKFYEAIYEADRNRVVLVLNSKF